MLIGLPKKFSDNVGEYIFRILYKCQDLNETITAVLELLGMHYYMSQNLIIVRDLDIGKYKVNNYWSSKNEDLTKVIDVTYHDYCLSMYGNLMMRDSLGQ